jgi:hypothetical protein
MPQKRTLNARRVGRLSQCSGGEGSATISLLGNNLLA